MNLGIQGHSLRTWAEAIGAIIVVVAVASFGYFGLLLLGDGNYLGAIGVTAVLGIVTLAHLRLLSNRGGENG